MFPCTDTRRALLHQPRLLPSTPLPCPPLPLLLLSTRRERLAQEQAHVQHLREQARQQESVDMHVASQQQAYPHQGAHAAAGAVATPCSPELQVGDSPITRSPSAPLPLSAACCAAARRFHLDHCPFRSPLPLGQRTHKPSAALPRPPVIARRMTTRHQRMAAATRPATRWHHRTRRT